MQMFTGEEYCKIDVANQYGLDKLNWNDRIEWFNDHSLPDLYSMVPDSPECPELMFKGLNAYRDALNGVPTGFIMGMDATASGPQLIACLTGCKDTASNCNLINTGKREDAYENMAKAMTQDGFPISRKEMKDPVMTVFYGSKAEPKKAFGEDTPALKQFYKTLWKEMPGGMKYLEVVQSCWNPEVSFYTWTLPDGHTVYMPVMVEVDKKIEIDELNHATFTFRAEVNQPAEYGISLAANVVHSIDGWVVREMIRRAHAQGFQMMDIHDSFWCHPNYVNQLRMNYRDILVELAEMDLLGSILSEITGRIGRIKKISNDLSGYIREAEYALS